MIINIPIDYFLYTCYTQVNENVTKLLRTIKGGFTNKTRANEQRDVQGKKKRMEKRKEGIYD